MNNSSNFRLLVIIIIFFGVIYFIKNKKENTNALKAGTGTEFTKNDSNSVSSDNDAPNYVSYNQEFRKKNSQK